MAPPPLECIPEFGVQLGAGLTRKLEIRCDLDERPAVKFLLWLLLLLLCWPLALLALLLWPVVWLLSLPFRLIGISVEAVFALLRALLFLPARLLGHKDA